MTSTWRWQPLLRFSFGKSSGWPFASAASFVAASVWRYANAPMAAVLRAAGRRHVVYQFRVELARLAVERVMLARGGDKQLLHRRSAPPQ